MRADQLEPIHVPLRSVFADGLTVAVIQGVATEAHLDEMERRFATFLAAIAEATGVSGDAPAIAARIRASAERAFVGMAPSARDAERAAAAAAANVTRAAERAAGGVSRHPAIEPGLDRRDRATLLAWLTLSRIGALAPGSDESATTIAWYDELRLPAALVAGLHDTGFDEGDAWAITDRVRVLLALPRPSTIGGAARSADARLMANWLRSEPVRTAIGVNTWEGVEYVDRGRFDVFLEWAVRLDTVDSEDPAVAAASAATARRLSAAANAAGYRVDRLLAQLRSGSTRKPSGPRTSAT
jgi:hypothetical protein